MPNPTLFLSYSSRSPRAVEIAHELAHSLRNDGYEVFLDKDDLPAGESFDDRIRQAIERSDGMVFLASPEALEPGAYTLTELGHAKRAWRSGRGRLLPVLLGEASAERLDAYLRVLNVLRPVGNPRAEILSETQRLWPLAAVPGPDDARRPPVRRASGWLLLVAAALVIALGVGAFVAFWRSGEADQPLGRQATTSPAGDARTAPGASPTGPADTGARSTVMARALALRDRVEPLLKVLRGAVSGDDYETPQLAAFRPALTRRTIGDIVAVQLATRTNDEDEQTVGAYQFVSADLKRLAQYLDVVQDVPFTPEVQDAMAIARLDQSGLTDFLSARIDETEFANAIAEIWAAAPVVSDTTGADGATVARGASYYQSYGKRPGITPEQILAALRTVRARAR